MNGLLLSIEDLRRYNETEMAVQNLTDEIAEARACADGLKATDYERAQMPAGDGAINPEERRRIALLDRIAVLVPVLAYKRGKLRRMETALSRLTEKERRVLWVFFVERPEDHIEVLSAELQVERSEVYRIKTRAANRFAEMLYGIVDG